MKRTLFTWLSCLLAFGWLASCEDKKRENIEKVSVVACQDAKDMIEAHTPLIGKVILNALAKEELKNGAVCECLLPSVKKQLDSFTAEELETMLIDKPKRGEIIKKALVQNRTEVFDCYKSKGLKGVKLIESFIEKLVK
jgi:hypothetical protein